MSYQNYEIWKTVPYLGEPHLSVIIPAYNEEIRIVPTIGAIASFISDFGFPWELIIADDGSTDRTVMLVESLDLANVRVLKTGKNGGKGKAVQRGVMAARGKYILFDDADNSTPIEELEKLLYKLEHEKFDIAIGSRAQTDEQNKSFLRHILSKGLRWIVQHAFKIGVRDTQCGFKLYTRKAAHHLHSVQTLMGFAFDLEILYLANKFGYRIAEVPVNWIDAPGSKVDTRKEVQRFLRDLLTIKLNDWQGVYANGY